MKKGSWGVDHVQPMVLLVRWAHQKQQVAGCWWLKLIILATQEAEIRRIVI
jgi:hypothetical protein